MKLPRALSRFKDRNILFFVAGKQEAVFYYAYDSRIDLVLKIKIQKPEYSDNEGKFRTSRGGRRVAGNIEMRRDEIVISEFLKEFDRKARSLKVKFDELYLFAPDMSRNWIKKALPKAWLKKIRLEKDGNYVKEPILKLLSTLEKESKKPAESTTREEQKIKAIPKVNPKRKNK